MQIKSNSVFITILAFSFFSVFSAYSFSIDEKLVNNEMELRAIDLFKIVRCLICSGESIYESQSQLAYDMRLMIRNKIKNGYNDNQIITELRNYYGNQITILPPYNPYTYPLWILPILIFGIGIIIIIKFIYYKI
ncbi:cytochrome C biogenesis family protein [Ehrlichia chaffeensis str. Heartland]|uniref:Cytochrome c-type biogenesis protein n=1 Tax=Ehrlichia chaffeensis (strain ATCC CRL-10679 / Arkansas) TaxID=205920 RepID=Q2GGI7_EHRCR|nr:cytochrome c-type biogenesis protein [Ehrlichia chaffeensis]ABD44714.1 cytochrome c biogenesis family protein [Ehrlichia chaffeensis str. Arkansas]AHX03717.1 cytochrome C biogenesis family protein [Ehrlichia chaffeensis str. Heartland]AHX05562.1 cytochrome C biogenesis family protein [Ehrlichia chaffeensis str. Jax]AHX06552.1 cytochrome C biogenesis family protein [Ehrlichia chaffeensis str. Liberty]AHX07751.1 cytochrome C biogenesis family protein [Ehrlichia chaffeensis str. Osceola]